MAIILSLETSTSVSSVAIHENERLLATSEIHIPQSAASKLALLIDDVKRNSGIELNQLNAIAISSGPGSYTGLRIGTSTAKGLCYALNIPLISIGSLDLMAHHVHKFNVNKSFLCPMIDARRMEVYCQVWDEPLHPLQPVEAKIIDENSFTEFLLKKEIIFFGDGAAKCFSIIKNKNAVWMENIFPSATDLGALAFQKFSLGLMENLVTFEPFYLKDFVAKKAVSRI